MSPDATPPKALPRVGSVAGAAASLSMDAVILYARLRYILWMRRLFQFWLYSFLLMLMAGPSMLVIFWAAAPFVFVPLWLFYVLVLAD